MPINWQISTPSIIVSPRHERVARIVFDRPGCMYNVRAVQTLGGRFSADLATTVDVLDDAIEAYRPDAEIGRLIKEIDDVRGSWDTATPLGGHVTVTTEDGHPLGRFGLAMAHVELDTPYGVRDHAEFSVKFTADYAGLAWVGLVGSLHTAEEMDAAAERRRGGAGGALSGGGGNGADGTIVIEYMENEVSAAEMEALLADAFPPR